ncbi:MAG: acetylglutamate kinase [Alphaproteobacteria bacterium]|nr:acetylglutamate kinase [Alphaproteobacteria bacterium]
MLRRAMDTHQPDPQQIENLAYEAFSAIPAVLRDQVTGVAIRVVDLPDRRTCRELELESPYDLLGLYHGVPLDERSLSDVPQGVDMIFLYRLPLLSYTEDTGEDLYDVVRHVLIHEIGHHFGFSDEEMEAIEAAADAED